MGEAVLFDVFHASADGRGSAGSSDVVGWSE